MASDGSTTNRRTSGWTVLGYLATAVWCAVCVAWGQPWQVWVGVAVAAFMAWLAGAATLAWEEDKR